MSKSSFNTKVNIKMKSVKDAYFVIENFSCASLKLASKVKFISRSSLRLLSVSKSYEGLSEKKISMICGLSAFDGKAFLL